MATIVLAREAKRRGSLCGVFSVFVLELKMNSCVLLCIFFFFLSESIQLALLKALLIF